MRLRLLLLVDRLTLRTSTKILARILKAARIGKRAPMPHSVRQSIKTQRKA